MNDTVALVPEITFVMVHTPIALLSIVNWIDGTWQQNAVSVVALTI